MLYFLLSGFFSFRKLELYKQTMTMAHDRTESSRRRFVYQQWYQRYLTWTISKQCHDYPLVLFVEPARRHIPVTEYIIKWPYKNGGNAKKKKNNKI